MPEHKETRTIKRFLWYPVRDSGGNWRWLETIDVFQIYLDYDLVQSRWVDWWITPRDEVGFQMKVAEEVVRENTSVLRRFAKSDKGEL